VIRPPDRLEDFIVSEDRPDATMIQVTEIRWIAEYRFCFRFRDNSVGACDLGPLLLKPRRTTVDG
jgi:hypothetical protein